MGYGVRLNGFTVALRMDQANITNQRKHIGSRAFAMTQTKKN